MIRVEHLYIISNFHNRNKKINIFIIYRKHFLRIEIGAIACINSMMQKIEKKVQVFLSNIGS